MTLTTPAQRQAAGTADFRMSGLLLLGLAVATASLHTLLGDIGWWLGAFGIMILVFGSAAAARYFFRQRWLGTVVGAVVATVAITLFFAADTAFLGIIPTATTIARFGSLTDAAIASAAVQSIPADATPGIQFLVCWLIALIAVVLDAVAIWARSPAWTGPLLLVVIVVPSIVSPKLSDAFFFELTAVAYLLIIRNRRRRVQPGVAIAVGAVAVLGALVVPLVLPPVTPAQANGTGSGLITESINPIINLGDDLRRATPTLALTYTTTADTGLYLRLTTLDSFEGREWAPVESNAIPGNDVSAVGPAPGLTKAIQTDSVSTTIQVANTSGRWLPVPYPETKIEGLKGSWFWEPNALAVRTQNSNMQGQKYAVSSLSVEPTQQQLESAPRSPNSPLAAVPRGLDPIVAKTAKEVVGKAKTDFDKAVALQDWFRGGAFTYSEHTPALSGFDGSGLDVIVPFLKSKSGYCVHFATTMAVMARTLDIPSRIGVGFLPGKATHPKGTDLTVYKVSSNDLHAWPELFFDGIGWVRFEPTPSRGFEPDFPSAPTAPSTSNPSDPSSPGATAAPTTTPRAAPRLPDEPSTTSESALTQTTTIPATGWAGLIALAVLLLLATPAIVRLVMRRRRLESVREGDESASRVWEELRESARDLGIDARVSSTPRELSAYLAEYLAAGPPPLTETLTALDQLRSTVEDESYAYPAYTFVGEAMASNLQTVLRGLRRATPLPLRLRALVLPPTLVDRALGRSVVSA